MVDCVSNIITLCYTELCCNASILYETLTTLLGISLSMFKDTRD